MEYIRFFIVMLSMMFLDYKRYLINKNYKKLVTKFGKKEVDKFDEIGMPFCTFFKYLFFHLSIIIFAVIFISLSIFMWECFFSDKNFEMLYYGVISNKLDFTFINFIKFNVYVINMITLAFIIAFYIFYIFENPKIMLKIVIVFYNFLIDLFNLIDKKILLKSKINKVCSYLPRI